MRIGFPLEPSKDSISTSCIFLEKLNLNNPSKVYIQLSEKDVRKGLYGELLYFGSDDTISPYNNHVDAIKYYQNRSSFHKIGELKYIINDISAINGGLFENNQLRYSGESSKLALLLAFAQHHGSEKSGPSILISASYSWDINSDYISIKPINSSSESLKKKWDQTVYSGAKSLLLHSIDAYSLKKSYSSIVVVPISKWSPENNYGPVVVSVDTNDIPILANILGVNLSLFNIPLSHHWGVGIDEPFVGLCSYEEKHHNIFYGREYEIDEVLFKIKSDIFLAIIGPSGVGKSSFVKAGVIPYLRNHINNSEDRQCLPIILRPNKYILNRFFDEIVKILDLNVDDILKFPIINKVSFSKDDIQISLNNICNILCDRKKSLFLLIYIDQFEEIFDSSNLSVLPYLFCFLDVLRELFLSLNIGYILISVRDDYWYKVLNEFKNDDININSRHSYYLKYIDNTNHLENIVKGPFQNSSKLFIHYDFIVKIVSDISGKPGSLPFLSLILNRMWDTRHQFDGVLSIAGYESLGRIEGVSDRLFDYAYKESTNIANDLISNGILQGRSIVDKILIHLARKIDSNINIVRNIVRADYMSEALFIPEDVLNKILQPFIMNRLFVVSKTDELNEKEKSYTIEVSHEIVFGTKKYKEILEENDDILKIAEKIKHSSSDYYKKREPLWNDEFGRLSIAEKCVQEGRILLTKEEELFLRKSRYSLIKRKRVTTFKIVSAFVILIITISIISYQYFKRAREENNAIVNSLISKAELWKSESKPADEELTFYRVASFIDIENIFTKKLIEKNIFRLSQYALNRKFSIWDDDTYVSYSHNGDLAVVSQPNEPISIYDVQSGKRVGQYDINASKTHGISFSEDDRFLSIENYPGEYSYYHHTTIIDLQKDKIILSKSSINVAFGTGYIAYTEDSPKNIYRKLYIIDTTSGKEIEVAKYLIIDRLHDASYVICKKNGNDIVIKIARRDGQISVSELGIVPKNEEGVSEFFLAANENSILTHSDNFDPRLEKIRLWDISKNILKREFILPGQLNKYRYSPDARRIAIYKDMQTEMWETRGPLIRRMNCGPPFKFSNNSDKFVCISNDKNYIEYEDFTKHEIKIVKIPNNIKYSDVGFLNNDKYILLLNKNMVEKVRLSNPNDGEMIDENIRGEEFVISKDNRYLVSFNSLRSKQINEENTIIQIWDLHKKRLLNTIENSNRSITITSDNVLYIESSDNQLIQIDIATNDKKILTGSRIGQSIDKKYIAIKSSKDTVKIYKNRGEICQLHDKIDQLIFEKDNARIVTNNRKEISIYNLQKCKKISSIMINNSNIIADKENIYIAIEENRLRINNVSLWKIDGKKIGDLRKLRIGTIKSSVNGKYVYVGYVNGNLDIYDINKRSIYRTIKTGNSDVIWNIEEGYGGERIILLSRGEPMQIWKNENGKIEKIKMEEYLTDEQVFDKEKTIIVVKQKDDGYKETHLEYRIVDIYTGVETQSISDNTITKIIAISLDGKYMYGINTRKNVISIPINQKIETQLLNKIGDESNLRICKNSLKVVPVIPYPNSNTVWAPENFCR